jgi:hypothetical protein
VPQFFTALKSFFLDPQAGPKKALIFFLSLALAFHGDKILFGPLAKVRFQDTFDHPFSRIIDFGRYLRDFGLVEWYPAVAGGLPLNADQTTLFYPLVLLAQIIPPWAAYTILTVTLGFMAGYGFYRMVTEFFAIRHPFALLGGTLFFIATSFHFGGLAFNVFIFAFPMIFVLLHGAPPQEAGRLFRAARLTLLATICLVSFPFLGLVKFTLLHGALLLLIFYRHRRIDWNMVAVAAIFWAGYGLLFLPNFLALLDYLPFIHRLYNVNEFSGAGDVLLYALTQFPVLFIVRTIIVDHYQILGLLLASAVLFTATRMTKAFFLTFITLALISTFFYSKLDVLFANTLIQKIDLYYVRWTLPFISILFITSIFEELDRQSEAQRRHFVGLMFSGMLGLIIAFISIRGLARVNMAMILVPGFLTLFVFFALRAISPDGWRFTWLGNASRAVNGALAALLLFVVLMTGMPLRVEQSPYLEAFGPQPTLEKLAGEFRNTPFRVAMVGLHPAQAQAAGLETFGGSFVLVNRYYKDYAGLVVAPQFRDSEKEERFRNYWYHLLMSEWDVHPRFTAYVPSSITAADWNLDLLAAANVRYIIAGDPVPGLEIFETSPPQPQYIAETRKEDSVGPVFVYALPNLLPRGYLTPRIEVLENRAAVLARLTSASPSDLATTAFLTQEDADGLDAALFNEQTRSCGEIISSDYGPDQLVFEVSTQAPCMLIVSNNVDPKWRATINGEPISLLRVNHAFMGLRLSQPGEHRVELVFDDPRFPAVLAAVPLGALVIVLAPLAGGVNRRRKRASEMDKS